MLPVFGMAGNAQPPRVINSGSAAAPGFFSQPSSNHPGGAVAAFCDGHTEFLKDALQPRVYAQLLSWDDSNAMITKASVAGADYANWRGSYSVLNEADYK